MAGEVVYSSLPSYNREYSFDAPYGDALPVTEEDVEVDSPLSPIFQYSLSLKENSLEIERRPSRRTSPISTSRNGTEMRPLSGYGSGKVQMPQGLVSKSRSYDLCIQKLTYKVKEKETGTRTKKERIILNGVNANARHGEVLGIFGPSGAGKTTLLDALAGRIDRRSLDGSVLVNGKPMDGKFRRISGYIMQEDSLFPMLTVRETLLFSARLRLQESQTYAQKQERVELVIQQLSLSLCANTQVGNDTWHGSRIAIQISPSQDGTAAHSDRQSWAHRLAVPADAGSSAIMVTDEAKLSMRGISRGERRRVSIGVEVIHDPAVLLLDEPTFGLDSVAALQVMGHLSSLAKQQGRTVILSLHQPSYSILETIHNTLVLVQGNVVFHGPHSGMTNYFVDLGYGMPEHMTVVEYILETARKCQERPKGLQKLVEFYLDSRKGQTTKDEQIVLTSTDSPTTFATSFTSQIRTLAERALINTFRTKELFITRLGLMVVGAIVLGSLFFRCKQDETGVRQRLSFFGCASAFLLFSSSQLLPLVLSERRIFIRETSRMAYHTSAYVVAESLAALPFLLILAAVFSGISYVMVGLDGSVSAIAFYLIVVLLVLAMGYSLVSFIAALIPHHHCSNDCLQSVLAVSFLFSGFFIQRAAIPKYWLWMNYLSLFKYPYEALMSNEFKHLAGVVWFDDVDSDEVLERLTLAHVHKWPHVGVMVVFIVVYRLLFYLALKFNCQTTRK